MSSVGPVKLVCIILGFMSVTMLVGCKSPYALETSAINYDAQQIAASITITDPKLYKRESLINERNAESAYLKGLLAKSATAEFHPEMRREIQADAALSSAAGLRFGPSSAIDFKRSRETTNLQQEIQTPVNQNLGNASASPMDQFLDRAAYRNLINSAKNAVSLDELHDKNGAALIRLSFSATILPPKRNYRDTLGSLTMQVREPLWDRFDLEKSYLDWLDHVNNHFNISVDGNEENPEKFENPEMMVLHEIGDLFDIVYYHYYKKLNNKEKNAVKCSGISFKVVSQDKKHCGTLTFAVPRLSGFYPFSPETEYTARKVNILSDHFGKQLKKDKDGFIKKFSDAENVLREYKDKCEYFFPRSELEESHKAENVMRQYKDKCKLFLPRSNLEDFRKAENVMRQYKDKDELLLHSYELEEIRNAENFLRQKKDKDKPFLPPSPTPIRECSFNLDNPLLRHLISPKEKEKPAIPVREMLINSFQLYWLSQQQSAIEFRAKSILNKRQRTTKKNNLEDFRDATLAASSLIATFLEQANNESCPFQGSAFMPTAVPFRFIDQVKKPSHVAIYEVGPREQAQQLSTVARASEAIGLAAAISGQIPMYATGVDGNVDYARSATGKADALERVPLVVSFTHPSMMRPATAHLPPERLSIFDTSFLVFGGFRPPYKLPLSTVEKTLPAHEETLPAFGWLFGPRMSLDPKKQKLVLEHRLKPYDLFVDLSVPGWWPYLILETTTTWAPNWGEYNDKDDFLLREIKVNLSPNTADFAALTNSLRGASSIRRVSIDNINPKEISACAEEIVIEITGESVWRASTVIIGGRQFDGEQVKVMPDMRGVLVSIKEARFPVPFDTKKINVTVLTPYGYANHRLDLKDAKSDGSCPSNSGFKSGEQTGSNNKASTVTRTGIVTTVPTR